MTSRAENAAVPIGLAVLLAGLSMISPFSIDTFFPSFRAIQAEFALDDFQIQQTLTAYLLPFAFMSLFQGPLSDALGRRPVVLVGIALYAAASLACVFAPGYKSLLFFRAMQGMTAGVGLIVGRAIVRDLYEGPNAQRLMSAVTMIFSVAPAVAPVVGGWVHVAFGWRAVFGFLCLLGLALLLACYLALPETHPPERRVPFSAGGLLRTAVRVIRTRRFTLLAFASAINFGSLLAYIGSAPAIVLDRWGLKETQFGHLFVPIIAGFLLGAYLSGRMAGRMPQDRQIALGFATTAVAALGALLLNSLIDMPPRLLQQTLLSFMALGVQLIFPVLTLQMLDMFPEARGSAASMQSFISVILIAFIIGAVAPLLGGSLLWLSIGSLAAVTVAALLWRASLRSAAVPRHPQEA